MLALDVLTHALRMEMTVDAPVLSCTLEKQVQSPGVSDTDVMFVGVALVRLTALARGMSDAMTSPISAA